MIRSIATLVLLACTVVACDYGEALQRDEAHRLETLRARAHFDLDCDSDLDVTPLDSMWDADRAAYVPPTRTAGVRGCGRRATYTRGAYDVGWDLLSVGLDGQLPTVASATPSVAPSIQETTRVVVNPGNAPATTTTTTTTTMP